MARTNTVTVVVDNPSWILPYAEQLVQKARELGFTAVLARAYADVPRGEIAFYLGCVSLAPSDVLGRQQINLVVHESDLPSGRGFAPVAWQVLEGRTRIPVVLFEAVADADAGPVYLRDEIVLQGHELHDEIRRIQGAVTIRLCTAFLEQYPGLAPTPQRGAPTTFRRRTPRDSALDPDKSLREQFNLLRTVDNERYPAFFDLNGHRYVIKIYPGE